MPLSIATTEGSRRQTAKSKLLEVVTVTLTTTTNSTKFVISVDPNKSSTLINDLIAAIRVMTKIPEILTYRQPVWKLLGMLPKGYRCIDLVADTYQEVSIKNCKRLDRATSVRLMINSPGCKVPSDFTKPINCSENKTHLINLTCEVSSNYKRALLHW